LLLCFAFAGCRAQTLAGADHRDGPAVAAFTSILCKRACDFYFITELHCRARPSTALQSVRRTHFKAPILYGAVRLFDIDIKPYVGVRPFDLCYKTLDGYCLTCIELCRKRMVGDCRCR